MLSENPCDTLLAESGLDVVTFPFLDNSYVLYDSFAWTEVNSVGERGSIQYHYYSITLYLSLTVVLTPVGRVLCVTCLDIYWVKSATLEGEKI